VAPRLARSSSAWAHPLRWVFCRGPDRGHDAGPVDHGYYVFVLAGIALVAIVGIGSMCSSG
jgi:hypothetical protein